MTATNAEEVLEAAHIKPYAAAGANSVCNGLLLRSDIHVLFDLGLLSTNPVSRSVFCSKVLRNAPPYSKLHGKRVALPKDEAMQPDFNLLNDHFTSTKG